MHVNAYEAEQTRSLGVGESGSPAAAPTAEASDKVMCLTADREGNG
jgi:hypothetical protein